MHSVVKLINSKKNATKAIKCKGEAKQNPLHFYYGWVSKNQTRMVTSGTVCILCIFIFRLPRKWCIFLKCYSQSAGYTSTTSRAGPGWSRKRTRRSHCPLLSPGLVSECPGSPPGSEVDKQILLRTTRKTSCLWKERKKSHSNTVNKIIMHFSHIHTSGSLHYFHNQRILRTHFFSGRKEEETSQQNFIYMHDIIRADPDPLHSQVHTRK